MAARTGSSMVMLTPDFCWLMERRNRVSVVVTVGGGEEGVDKGRMSDGYRAQKKERKNIPA